MIVGIDFGTTNSVISEGGRVLFIEPTHIYIDATSITSIKRLIGITYKTFLENEILQKQFNNNCSIVKDPYSEWCAVQIENQCFSIIDIVSRYLVSLIGTRDELRAVLTVPAHYTDVERNILKTAAEMAGIEVIRFINEPTAAALAYHFHITNNTDSETILVLDCGGGTTDVSIVHMDYESAIFQVESTAGNSFLGGEDLTNNLVDYVIEKVPITIGVNNKQLKEECEEAKKRLSYQLSTSVITDSKQVYISRAKFIELNKDFFESIKSLIIDASFGFNIDKYILVGGTTRFPYFKDLLCNLKGQDIEICDSMDPKHVVSIGAAYQALSLTSTEDTDLPIVIDVVGATIGVETTGGLMTPIISKNTQMPASCTKVFTNDKSYISNITIKVFAGNRKLCTDNTFLGSFTLNGLDDSLKKGEMNIRIKFEVDSNGLLSVSAFDSKTNAISRLELTQKVQETATDDFDDILNDSKVANRIFKKQELYHTFLELLVSFHVNRNIFVEDAVTNRNNFYMMKLNKLFNRIFNVIVSSEVNSDEIKSQFERDWNYYIVNLPPHRDQMYSTLIDALLLS
jgi:molecular chaperone DnaK (HSP70)